MLLKCPECGAPVIDRVDACRECGCPIDYIKSHQGKKVIQLRCPECDNTFDEGLVCCPECGCPASYAGAYHKCDSPIFSATTAPNMLIAAANKGNADAMYWLANCMYFGENGFRVDAAESNRWLKKAIELGHSQAQADYPQWFPVVSNVQSPKDIALKKLLSNFDSIIVFDLETSGLDPSRNSIIELAAIKVRYDSNHIDTTETMNEMVLLPPNEVLSSKIVELTGITNEQLRSKGKVSSAVCNAFVDFIGNDKPLMISYNAQFDLGFLCAFLSKNHHGDIYSRLHTIDALTVYRDRRPYPHKLCDAISAYNLESTVHNSHRAIDDAYSLLEVVVAMETENPDLHRYIDLFGYLPKYGVNGAPLPGIHYKAQPYNSTGKLYER